SVAARLKAQISAYGVARGTTRKLSHSTTRCQESNRAARSKTSTESSKKRLRTPGYLTNSVYAGDGFVNRSARDKTLSIGASSSSPNNPSQGVVTGDARSTNSGRGLLPWASPSGETLTAAPSCRVAAARRAT